jgi:hypothetical protein
MRHGRIICERQFSKRSGWMKVGASHERHHSTVRHRGLRCGASTFGQDSGAMMVAGGRINVDAGRLRVEAAGSDGAIDRDFSGPAGFRTDWLHADDSFAVVEIALKKTSAVEEGGGEPSSGNTANASETMARIR